MITQADLMLKPTEPFTKFGEINVCQQAFTYLSNKLKRAALDTILFFLTLQFLKASFFLQHSLI